MLFNNKNTSNNVIKPILKINNHKKTMIINFLFLYTTHINRSMPTEKEIMLLKVKELNFDAEKYKNVLIIL